MKKSIVIIAFLFVSTIGFSQIKSKVFKVNGIEVYLLAEPVREYESLKGGGKGIQWGSAVTGGIINESIATRVSKYIKKLQKSFEKEGLKFDAIIYSNGKQMTAIKFTDEKTSENDRVAVIQRVEGIPFFVMSEPLKEYSFVETIGGGIKWKSAITGGLMNNSIEQDLMKFAKKMSKKFKKKQISAIIYERGKKANAIKF
jgi:molybdopterin converting factor small subunit